MAYGADEAEPFRRVAVIDKILKGTKPADIPVTAEKFEFIINRKQPSDRCDDSTECVARADRS